MQRNSEPSCIADLKGKKWRSDCHGYRDIIFEKLLEETEYFCPFSFVLLSLQDDGEIEHFRPQSKFENLIFEWSNLFPIASKRNKCKGEKWDELLLKPDVDNYLNYFEFIPNSGEIQPKLKLDAQSKNRASLTIEIYGLNKEGICNIRKLWYKKYIQNSDDSEISFYPIFNLT